MSEESQKIGAQIAAETDANLKELLNDIGYMHTVELARSGRLTRQRRLGENWEVFCLDGQPLLQMFDPEYVTELNQKGDAFVTRVVTKYVRLRQSTKLPEEARTEA